MKDKSALRDVGAAYLEYLRFTASFNTDGRLAFEQGLSAATIALLKDDLPKLLRAGARLEQVICRCPEASGIPLDGLRSELKACKALLTRLNAFKTTSWMNGGAV